MKIYFAGSIRGGRQDQAIYLEIVNLLREHGEVLTEHVSDPALSQMGEPAGRDDTWIYERDMKWLRASDVLVAEVTTPSLGVGYEIGQMEAIGKPILCLYRPQPNKLLSAMLTGNRRAIVAEYSTTAEVRKKIAAFIAGIHPPH